MTDKSLEIFRLVAEYGSNSEVARRLNISQPSVSRAITRLEDEFNTKLINRDSIPFTVTPYGIVLLNLIDDGMSTKQRFKRYIDEQTMKQMNIGFSFPASCSLFASELSRYKLNEPSIILRTFSGDNKQIREMLVNGKLDVALLPDRINFSGYKMYEVVEGFEWGLVAPDGVPITDNHYIRSDELRNLPLLIPADAMSRKEIEQWVKDTERTHLADTYNSIETLIEMIHRGYGAGFAPRIFLPHLNKYNLAFYLLSPKIFTTIYIYVSVNEEKLNVIRPFLDLLSNKIK